MNPFEFMLVPQCSRKFGIRECIDKVQNIYSYIGSPIVIWEVEVSNDVSLLTFVFQLYSIGMCLDSIHTPQFCLAYIL